MYERVKNKLSALAVLLMAAAVMTGCGGKASVSAPGEEQKGGFVTIAPGAYDSADTAIVMAKQEKKKTITFFNLMKKKNYTLNYDGTTGFLDKYGSSMAVSQLKEGELVELRFLKDEKRLTHLEVSSEVWTYDNVSNYELDVSKGTIEMFGEVYNFNENTAVISEGKPVELMDLNAVDVLSLKGRDHQIYSIIVEQGHGYLRLENEEYFIGGWIEVGQKLIQKIEEEMLLVVPEGEYEVFLSNSGIEGFKEVNIKRNQETKLDVGDLKKEDLIKYGSLIFTVTPSDAKVYIDGNLVDITRSIKAEYGLHQIMAKAEGYETVIQYIRVTGEGANLAITLDEEKEHSISDNSVKTDTTITTPVDTSTDSSTESSSTEDSSSGSGDSSGSTESSSNSSTSENSTTAGSTTGYKVTIESPKGAEVYVDGNYVGVIPASFSKKEGSHVVTIRKTGYMSRSYTIDVDDEEKDITYSFSDLTPIE